nr:MAG TPA: hypothetical protein [Caudoviricetes sp.]
MKGGKYVLCWISFRWYINYTWYIIFYIFI